MKYLFILGRNVELSIAEIRAYLNKEEKKIVNSSLKENGFLVELEEALDAGVVNELGGVIAIGIVVCELKEIDRKEVYYGEENKFNYVIWNFSEKTPDISDYLKKRFRSEKLKTTEKNLTGRISLQDGGKIENVNSNLIDEEYFVFEDYFGRIIEKYDYSKIEERDMKKPVRRENLAISPRLAKIMINLSEIKEGENLVDCFCGIGVILQEALLKKMNTIGIDKDSKAIEGARENMKWFGFNNSDFKLLNDDSSKVRITPVKVLVSEPDFGETLRKTPTKLEAEQMIKRYEGIMLSVLGNMKKYVEKKFVFTSPLIRIGKERIGCNFSKLCSYTGLKIKTGPIPEFRGNQIVGREIVVLEKS
jgi:tRNA G10  N-methylase Trm11